MNNLAVGYDAAGCFEVVRYPQCTGKIVGGTQGEEAQHRVLDRLCQAGRVSQGVNGVHWYPISAQTVERQAEGRLPDARARVHYEGGATEVRPLERGPPGSPIESVYFSFVGACDCGLFDH